jgi:putative tricarboxylic transport membrane protein
VFDGLRYFFEALASYLDIATLFTIGWSTLLGMIIGMLPGLSATLGIALMTTMTYKLGPSEAILILICVYVGAIYGGSRSAILINIPGTAANAATTLDGYPLARQGLAGYAMGVATAGSTLGSFFGMICLAIFSPILAEFALKFQSFEFFWLAVLGIVIAGRLTALADPIKGWIAGFIGLLLALVGQEALHSYPRFSYGVTDLAGGFGLLPVLVGVFGMAEVFSVMKQAKYSVVRSATDSVIPKIRDVLKYWKTIIRSGVIGTTMGLLPGVGEDMGAWASYAAARASSKEKDKFGKGSVEGLMAAETGNNAAVPGAIIPVLTLAVPGSAPAAVLLAAMFIHGVRPGPLIMIETPAFVFQVVAMIFMATIAILVLGLSLTKPMLKVLLVPRDRLMPAIFILCAVGAYAITSRTFDIYVALIFGIIGFVMRELKYPMAPLVLGVVLGPMLDVNLRRGLILTDGDITPFFTRPISLVLMGIIFASILFSLGPVLNLVKRFSRRGTPGPKPEAT